MILFYYSALFLCSIVSTFTIQKYGRASKTFTDIFVFALITSVVAMGFFSVTAGFRFEINARAFGYSAVLSFICILASVFNILTYRYLGAGEAQIFKSSVSLILSFASGFLLFKEKFTPISLIRASIMLAAILILFSPKRTKEDPNTRGKTQGKKTIAGFLFCLVTATISCASTITSKYIAIDDAVTNTNSLFFFTNVWMVLFSVLALLVLEKCNVKRLFTELSTIGRSGYACIVTNTVASNITSLLGVLILAVSSVSYYAPVSGALALLASEAVDIAVSRKLRNPIPMILAIVAILLGFFE